jgi:hypothetical protein
MPQNSFGILNFASKQVLNSKFVRKPALFRTKKVEKKRRIEGLNTCMEY